MAIDKKNEYVIGSNQDLSNALLNIDLNRVSGDLTYLEDDAGTLKVSIGSLIEANGSIYAVSGSAETPTGTAEDGAYLFFDPSGPSFAWSTTPGTYDATLGGIYDASDRRQCRFRLKSATTWDVLLVPESPDLAIEGDLTVEGTVGDLTVAGLDVPLVAISLGAPADDGVVYDALAPYVLDVDDARMVTGSMIISGNTFSVGRYVRYSTTQIGIHASAASVVTVQDGDTGTIIDSLEFVFYVPFTV